ncbi:MAG: hypothetical protein FWD42_05240 [Solirubrobacterales bacterium]|nr:hypothetical protein [Solirubrobacterales bacterium]
MSSLLRAAVSALCLAIASVALWSPVASADVEIGEGGTEAGQLEQPTGVAVDESNGDVYVAEANNARVSVFEPQGASLRFAKAFGWGVVDGAQKLEVCTSATGCQRGLYGAGAGEFNSSILRVAVDNDQSSPSWHDVYVYDGRNYRVEKFSESGEFILMFGKDVNKTKTEETTTTEAERDVCTAASGDQCQTGAPGTGAGQFAEYGAHVAIDSSGTVWVADKERLEHFEPTGTFVSQIELPGQSTELFAVGAEPGFYTGFTVKEAEKKVEFLPKDEVIERYKFFGGAVVKRGEGGEALFTLDDTFGLDPKHWAVAVDPAGNLFVYDTIFDPVSNEYVCTQTGGNGCQPPVPEGYSGMVEFNASGNEIEQWDVAPGILPKNAIAVDEHAGVVYAVPGEEAYGLIEIPLPPPGPAIREGSESAGAVGSTGATLAAIVSPENHATTYRFQYLSAEAFAQGGYANPSVKETSTAGPLTATFSEAPVSADVGELQPDTTYHFRLVAENECESGRKCVVDGADATFTTKAKASFGLLPIAEPSATSVTPAVLVNPNGQATSVHFQYWIAGQPENATASQTIGSGTEYAVVKESISGLRPGVAYHLRAVAENALGTIAGPEESFTTAGGACPNAAYRTGASAALAECRAYEQVTPAVKNGAPPRAMIATEADGEGLAFYSQLPLPGATAGTISDYVARRTAGAWGTTAITPPTVARATESPVDAPYVVGMTPDLREAVIQTAYPIDPEAQGHREVAPSYEQPSQVYRREADGSFTWVSEPPTLPDLSPWESLFLGASSDLSHIVFATRKPMTAQTQGSSALNLYEYADGKLETVNVAPHTGALLPGGAVLANDGETRGLNYDEPEIGTPFYQSAVSQDGSTVFFVSPKEGTHELYARVGGETREVSVSHLSGDAGQPAPDGAQFIVAAAGGSKVLFYCGDPLAEGAPRGGGIYEYEVASGELRFVGQTAGAFSGEEVIGATPDLSYVYLWGGANTEDVYLLHDGSLTVVGAIGKPEGRYGGEDRQAAMSPDGRHVAFLSGNQITPYQNDGQAAIYEYDAESGATACVSCRPDGAPPANGSPTLYAIQRTGFSAIHPPVVLHDVTNSGAVFFDTEESLVTRDVNQQEDVYEYRDGVIYLISSGTSSAPSALAAISENGDNAFFFTYQSLVPQDTDGGVADIYDARVGGGFPAPTQPVSCASSEECSNPVSTPTTPTAPASALFTGLGNVTINAPATATVTKRQCSRNTLASHGRCVRRPKAKPPAKCVKRRGGGRARSCAKARRALKRRGAPAANRRGGR